jgi:hypothetical protein
MTIELSPICDRPTSICNGCAKVAQSIGITLSAAHKSCKQVTLENIAEAARHLGVPLMEMFDPV